MIFFSGNSSALIKSETSYYTTCPICEQKGQVVFYVYGKYFHFMFIPCFPNGRDLSAHCMKCNSVIDYPQMSKDMKNEIFEFSNKQRRSILHYTGLSIFLFGFLLFLLLINKYDNQKAHYIANPEVNDIYNIISDSDKYYSIMRLEKTKGDSAYFSTNKYSVSNASELHKINIDENFKTSRLLPIAIKDLDLKNVNGMSLYSIDRPKNEK